MLYVIKLGFEIVNAKFFRIVDVNALILVQFLLFLLSLFNPFPALFYFIC